MTMDTLHNRMLRRKAELEADIKKYQESIMTAAAGAFQTEHLVSLSSKMNSQMERYRELCKWLNEMEGEE